jgi:hypothetical protein
MSEVKPVFIQIRGAQGSDPGQIHEGYYTRADDVITLTYSDGTPIRRSRDEKWQASVGPDDNEKALAKGLLRRLFNTENPNSEFWQPLPYKPPTIW